MLSGNVSDEDYAVAKEDMYRNNVMMLRVLSAIATTIFIVCAILGVTVPNMNSKMSTYLVGMAFSIAILLAAFYSKNAKLHTICMCFLDVMLLSVGLLITLVSAPQQLTVTLIPVALLVPLNFDTDNDGLSDGFEITNGFDPLKEDTDNNGIIDGKERLPEKQTHTSMWMQHLGDLSFHS